MESTPADANADRSGSGTGATSAEEREAAVRAAVAGSRFADVRWKAETGSTNVDVLELIRSGEPEGIVVAADHQSAGRGRRGRTWAAPPNASLMFTVLLRPRAEVAGLTTMALGLAASDAVAELCGAVPRLKWPNDLVWTTGSDARRMGDAADHEGSNPTVGRAVVPPHEPSVERAVDRKLAGILAEAEWPAGSTASGGPARQRAGQRVAVAAGIGINVAWGDRFPDELRATAVALDEITRPNPAPDRADLLVALIGHLDRHYRDLDADGGSEVLIDRWRDRSATLGRRVRVDLGADDLEGTAVDVTAEGHLVIDAVDGRRRTVAVGDVVHLRPLDGGR